MTGGRPALTRAEVAARLGVSTSTVRRMKHDVLHSEHDERGVWRFDPAEVDEVAAKHSRAPARAAPRLNEETRAIARRGRLAARVFKMFARHTALPQIVVLTKQPPEVVCALYHEWMTSLDEGEWNDRANRS